LTATATCTWTPAVVVNGGVYVHDAVAVNVVVHDQVHVNVNVLDPRPREIV
jgi:hypothetical protein